MADTPRDDTAGRPRAGLDLGRMIDQVIAPFAPAAAARRMSARMGMDAIRQYEAAARDRRTQGWRRPSTSGNAESAQGLVGLRNGARDLVRNNKYAAAGVRQLTASIVGDGIAPQFTHADKALATKAQDAWDRWAESKVDGFDDFYGVEKLAARGMIEGGETLIAWKADDTGPDGRVQGLEGDYIDPFKVDTLPTHGVRRVQGVELQDGAPTGFWLLDHHPGDRLPGQNYSSTLIPAQHIDHVYERLRFDQVRGVSWLAAVALTLRDVADIEDAVRLKKKVEACLALVISPPDGQNGSPLTGEYVAQESGKPSIETLRPGMIARLQAGESASTLIPTSTGDGVDIIRHQLAGVSANMVPYHLLTGDVSQANYSSLRAALLGHWAMLDDWQQNVMLPRMVKPAVARRMRVLALQTGDKRFLQLGVNYTLPVRRQVDPIKDLMAEVIEIRAGLKTMARALSERGLNTDEHMNQIKAMNDLIDQLGLALETDPRRLTDAGVLQLAAGYIRPQGGAAN